MTNYYVRLINDGMKATEDFWAVENNVAHQGIVPSLLGTHYADVGESIMTTLRKRFPGSQFHKLSLAPGEYFPRMARPFSARDNRSLGCNPDDSREARIIRTSSSGQLHVLIHELEQICMVVHPIKENFTAYGHEIRNIILIASTEVETQWKNILKANGIRGKNTNAYVKLSSPMKLAEYRASLTYYPWLDPIAPFENWLNGTPTKSLDWYSAYNDVKHDREIWFAKATLLNALKSVTGCFVMLCAQYGSDFALQGEAAEHAFFKLIDAPKWEPSEIYVPALSGARNARLYPFSAAPKRRKI